MVLKERKNYRLFAVHRAYDLTIEKLDCSLFKEMIFRHSDSLRQDQVFTIYTRKKKNRITTMRLKTGLSTQCKTRKDLIVDQQIKTAICPQSTKLRLDGLRIFIFERPLRSTFQEKILQLSS